mgnify:CR=1 FL=1
MAQFALVESGSVTKLLNGNQGIKIGDYNYPTDIYTKWTEAERNNIGIYTIENDDTNILAPPLIGTEINWAPVAFATASI